MKGNKIYYDAHKERKTFQEWLNDPRCQVSYTTLAKNLKNGMTFECALVFKDKGNYGNKGKAITAFGETKSISEWAKDERCKVAPASLMRRLQLGVCVEDALCLPPQKNKRSQRRDHRPPLYANIGYINE